MVHQKASMQRTRVAYLLLLLVCFSLCMHLATAIGKSLSDKDLQRLEDEWMEDEEEEEDAPFEIVRDENGKPKRRPDGTIDKRPKPQKNKMEMTFATVNTKNKEETEHLATKWTKLLKSAAITTMPYAVEDHKILFVINGGWKDMAAIKEFVLEQPELVEYEANQQKFKPKPRATSGEKKIKREKDQKARKKKNEAKQKKSDKKEL